MTMKECQIEEFAIKLLKAQGYEHLYGPDIAPDGKFPERAQFDDVVLVGRLRQAVHRLNPGVPPDTREAAIRQVLNIASPELTTANKEFHGYITEGVDVEYQKDGITRGDKVKLVDFNQPEDNEFLAVNQYTVIEENHNRRPDIVLFVNGLPLVVIELKNAVDENATVESAFRQIQTYKAQIPSLFTYNALIVISDALDALAGSVASGFSRLNPWKIKDSAANPGHITELEILIEGMLNPETLLELIKYFTVFEETKTEDAITGQVSVKPMKKVAYYHQYYAVKKAFEKTKKATSEGGDKKAGVIWHTQGSGKSLSMVFYAGKLVLGLDNPTIVIVTDRNDLDDQLYDTFCSSKQLLRQTPVQAQSRADLMEKLKVASGGIVFSTIQKFYPEEGEAVYPLLSDRSNIVVIADEAHRSHYGFKARTIDIKDAEGNLTGQKVTYGLAKFIRDALPNASFIGFTGTPIEFTDRNTPAVFGSYIDIYDIEQAEADEAIVKIYYESRMAKVRLDEQGKKLIRQLDEELEEEDFDATQEAKAKWTKLEAIAGVDPRIKNVVDDMLYHFELRREVFPGKAMFVSMSRRIAAKIYTEILRHHPSWHDDDPKKGKIKVVMTAGASDGPELSKLHTTKDQRRLIGDRFKDPDDPLFMVVVCDMWLTGFDVPCLSTMYVDKPMKGHNLMQAIARVNRVYLDKPGGLIVDYIGFTSELRKALKFYTQSGGKGDPALMQEKAVELMLEKLEVVKGFFDGFNYRRYFKADTQTKLSIILEAEEHILGLEDEKMNFLRQVKALSEAFALSIPDDEALNVKDEVGFFQAVKSRLVKFGTGVKGKSRFEIESAIRDVVDSAVKSDQVIDIFAAAGIDRPEISILSDEFLSGIKKSQNKNLALELLKKLLNDEIKVRSKTNIIQSKKLLEMLESVIKRYQNKLITAAQVIDELIHIAKEIKFEDERGEKMNLSPQELAFYDALSDNKSAKEVLGQEALRELAMVLVDRVRNNATIDWEIKESVRAKMRVIVKRLLRKYGYPPDKRAIATENIIKQAENYADIWSKESF